MASPANVQSFLRPVKIILQMLQPLLAGNSLLLMLSLSYLHSALGNLLVHAHLCLKVAADELSIAEWDLVLMVPCRHYNISAAMQSLLCIRQEGAQEQAYCSS